MRQSKEYQITKHNNDALSVILKGYREIKKLLKAIKDLQGDMGEREIALQYFIPLIAQAKPDLSELARSRP